MNRRVDVTRLSPLRRGFVIGYRRARHKARAEMAHMCTIYDAEIAELQRDYHDIAVEHHRECYDRAVDAAMVQRAADPDAWLH